ncbi:MAG: hypothetical protein DMD93_00460 [Candidatus Rokuibacteriota bacterium]|nr:MAG: hypothetical protein DMD93_00460 [Candidatus Rokubacteria bacterium]
MRELSRMIQQLRESKGMTQRDLADKAKVTPGYVAQLEMGLRKNPSLASLQGLAKALGVSLDDLMTDPREKLRRLKSSEVLREAALGGRTREWFEGALPDYPDPYVAEATKALEKAGFIEKIGDARTYRATEDGRAFLKRNRLDYPDWIIRAPLVNFRKGKRQV